MEEDSIACFAKQNKSREEARCAWFVVLKIFK
jgi:hypothetical protein